MGHDQQLKDCEKGVRMAMAYEALGHLGADEIAEIIVNQCTPSEINRILRALTTGIDTPWRKMGVA